MPLLWLRRVVLQVQYSKPVYVGCLEQALTTKVKPGKGAEPMEFLGKVPRTLDQQNSGADWFRHEI